MRRARGGLPALCCLAALCGEAAAASLDESLAAADAALSRFRAVGDESALRSARASLAAAAARAPGDYAVARAEVALDQARGDTAGALSGAQALVRRNPDDVSAWALLVDAELALARFEAAERDAQTLLDLRPDEPAALERAARLRAHFEDRAGAIEALLAALNRLPPEQTERRAAWLAELARLYLAERQPAAARAAASAALEAYPDHRDARAALAACDAAALAAVPRP